MKDLSIEEKEQIFVEIANKAKHYGTIILGYSGKNVDEIEIVFDGEMIGTRIITHRNCSCCPDEEETEWFDIGTLDGTLEELSEKGKAILLKREQATEERKRKQKEQDEQARAAKEVLDYQRLKNVFEEKPAIPVFVTKEQLIDKGIVPADSKILLEHTERAINQKFSSFLMEFLKPPTAEKLEQCYCLFDEEKKSFKLYYGALLMTMTETKLDGGDLIIELNNKIVLSEESYVKPKTTFPNFVTSELLVRSKLMTNDDKLMDKIVLKINQKFMSHLMNYVARVNSNTEIRLLFYQCSVFLQEEEISLYHGDDLVSAVRMDKCTPSILEFWTRIAKRDTLHEKIEVS